MAVIELAVQRFEQRPGRCGAATAQMILFYKNLVGSQIDVQDALWTQIQDNTGGARPSGVDIQATDCPTWLTQQCDQCGGAKAFTCWCTSPPALLAALTSYGLPMALTTPPTDQVATAAAIASVDFDIPAAVLVFNGLHWVAVAGYETNGANAQPIGGQQVSEIYIRDPEVNAANHNVAIDVWMDDYVSPVVQCGIFLNLLVVIAATARLAPPQNPNVPNPPTNIRILRRAVPKRRPPKPPRRTPPKPPRSPRSKRR